MKGPGHNQRLARERQSKGHPRMPYLPQENHLSRRDQEILQLNTVGPDIQLQRTSQEKYLRTEENCQRHWKKKKIWGSNPESMACVGKLEEDPRGEETSTWSERRYSMQEKLLQRPLTNQLHRPR